jgi:hypothetical protein
MTEALMGRNVQGSSSLTISAALLTGVALALPVLATGAGACERIAVIGSVTGSPEKDTVGRGCADPEVTGSLGSSRIVYSLPSQPFGERTGDPEKDTFGYAALADD